MGWGDGWSLRRTDGKVRVCDSLSGWGGSTSCLLSCDKSQSSWWGKLLGRGPRTLRSFWRLYLQAVGGIQRKRLPVFLSKPSAPNNQYAIGAHPR